MPFSTELKDGYLLVRHEGEVTLEEAQHAGAEALRLVESNQLTRVLVDIRRVTGDADPGDLRAMMEGHAKVLPPRPHAAIVVRADQLPAFRFVEDFAISRGMPIRVFVDEREALDWLIV
jgi:hypothetical protein